MKRLLFLFGTIVWTALSWAADIIVEPGQSLHEALRQAREWRRTADARCQGGITIRLMPGRHYMAEPLFIRPEDSGTRESPTIVLGEPGAVVCGDPVQQHTQLFPAEGMERILDFDPRQRTITIPLPPRQVLEQERLEMVVHQRWAIAILRVKTIAERDGRAVVTFRDPESRLEFEHPWPQPVIGGERGSSSFLLRTTEQRQGVEQLVTICGTAEHPVRHVQLRGLTFEHTCWNRPLLKGHVTLQGGFPLVDAYKLTEPEGLPWDAELENQAWVKRPVSAVCIKNADSIVISGCHFRQLGATALDYESGIGGFIEDCTFEDIGGTAILAGSFAECPLEVHRPYGHLASRCSRLTIRRNTIRGAAQEDWGAVGIGVGYAANTTIDGNDLSGLNYSGICVGWGWTPAYTGAENNHIINNKVSDYARQLYDAGGIYTLSNQPRSTITGNVIGPPAAAPYATNHRAFRIYLDARTDGFTLEGNTTGGRPLRRDEIGDNHPGPNLMFKP